MLFILAGVASSAGAETLPWNIQVDSSFRAEFLFGHQEVRHLDASVPSTARFLAGEGLDRFSVNFDPRVPVLAGVVEITPFPTVSGRLAGSIGVFENSTVENRRAAASLAGIEWDVKPNYSSWEAAGLYHLWNGGGYRFSVTAGYRREIWDYRGRPANGSPGSPLHDSFASSIPFFGLQTAMIFPLWKARFEVLGSPFMSMNVSDSAQVDSFALQFDGNLYSGGLVEVQMEGNTNITPNVLVGLYSRYAYTELYGSSSGTGTVADVGLAPYTVFVNQSMATVGLNVTVFF